MEKGPTICNNNRVIPAGRQEVMTQLVEKTEQVVCRGWTRVERIRANLKNIYNEKGDLL